MTNTTGKLVWISDELTEKLDKVREQKRISGYKRTISYNRAFEIMLMRAKKRGIKLGIKQVSEQEHSHIGE